jgi:hypothetical protein
MLYIHAVLRNITQWLTMRKSKNARGRMAGRLIAGVSVGNDAGKWCELLRMVLNRSKLIVSLTSSGDNITWRVEKLMTLSTFYLCYTKCSPVFFVVQCEGNHVLLLQQCPWGTCVNVAFASPLFSLIVFCVALLFACTVGLTWRYVDGLLSFCQYKFNTLLFSLTYFISFIQNIIGVRN